MSMKRFADYIYCKLRYETEDKDLLVDQCAMYDNGYCTGTVSCIALLVAGR